MITLNIELVKEYFLINNDHNILFDIDSENLVIHSLTIENLVKDFINNPNSQLDGLYTIKTTQELVIYIGHFLFSKHKAYRKNFKSQDDFLYYLCCLVSMFLTQFNSESLRLLEVIPKFIVDKIDGQYVQKVFSYVESSDPRGLLFFLAHTYTLPYDKLVDNEDAIYVYNEPSINKSWQKKYKQEGEPIQFWFYNSILGKGLFLVLFAPKCRYKMEKGGCAGCNLPTVSSTSKLTDDKDIQKQIDFTFDEALSEREKQSVYELMLSNNGSILDPSTMSTESLEYMLSKSLQTFPKLAKVLFETRIDEYSDYEQLTYVTDILKEQKKDIAVELAVGFEIFDDELRNGYYKKGIYKDLLEQKIASLSDVGNVSLKVYMMYKAVPDRLMSVDEAIEDINKASHYFAHLSYLYGIAINLHISPTYLATGTQLFKEHTLGLYNPPSTKDITKLYKNLQTYDSLTYYISMNDEGLSDEVIDNSEYNSFLELKDKINYFNITQKR